MHDAIWAAVALVVAGCGSGSEQIATTRQPGPPTIDVVRVIQQPLDVVLSMPGELYSYEAVAVYPKVTGFVKAIHVDRGSHVRAGELMAEIEAPELVAQRAEAQSKLQAAQAQLAVVQSKADGDAGTYDRLEAASATPGVVAGNDLLLAQKAVEADQNQIAAALQMVEASRQALQAVTQVEAYLHVAAPFDGVITERNVHPGALVGPNSGAGTAAPMVRLEQNDRLRLVVPVPQSYVTGIREGAMIAFTVPAYPSRTFTGRVARLAHTVDVETRTMAVELDVINRDGGLVPGTFCQIQWPINRPEPSLFVPAGSITSTTDRTFVVRIRNGRTEWVDVRPGLTSGSLTEVFGDLRPGDVVASRGTDEIRPATEVRINELHTAT